LVPVTLREASMALGIPRWRTVISVVISTGKTGLATGVLLAVARAAGETAPLLLTALGSNFFSTGLFQPTAALPLLIYFFALSPYSNQVKDAWGATLFLLILILIVNIVSRLMIHRMAVRMGGT
jgi:phosphate transport system permease protein